MRIGFDVDGVLAQFIPAYQKLFVKLTGQDLFLPNDATDPPTWHWPKLRGYTDEETRQALEAIGQDPTFWLNLEEERDAVQTVRVMLKELERKHDLYFVSNRHGERVKRQTEIWLFDHLGYPMRVPGVYPTVLIAGHRKKGEIAQALHLDVYIDDNYDNVCDCAEKSPATRTYLLNRSYNLYGEDNPLVVRVNTVGEMLDHELNNL